MSRVWTLPVALVIVTAWAAPAAAQRNLTNIPDPDPELERKSFQVADGFEVNLFAADPMLAKPIQMNWDAAGRLWVASSEVYPQIQPGQVANDKILVLEDRDGDGRADKTTVFADGLLIPTGVEPGDGGAYVANSTELLFLQDTDGDGKADARRIVLSGFGTEDTHHIIHTFRWGHDGMLYFNQSIYIHSHIETPWGVRRLGGGGIWQFRPESSQLQVFCRGFVNPWGHHFDDWGQSFATDGAYGEGINYVFPGATFFSAPGATRILKGLNPGSPKHCGLEIASGRHLPDDWQGNMLTNDFRGNRVCRFVVSEDASGYASREMPELIKTNHVAFRPIDIKMGPDGAIYIADWYNPIIQHGEVDFRDPRRDHTRGRIWRVTAKGRPLVERPRLVDASTAELLDALKSPEQWTRHFAKRMLKERGAAQVVPALAAWAKALDPKDPRTIHHSLETLWTYQSLDTVEPVLLRSLLRSPDHRVRAAATRVVSQWHDRIPNASGLLEVQVADEHPRVRLEAVRALGQMPQPGSAELAMRALQKPIDQFLDYALWLTARDLEPFWLPTVSSASRSSEMGFDGNPLHQVYALLALSSPVAVHPLLVLLNEGKVPPDSQEAVLTLVGTHGSADELGRVFDLVVSDDGSAGRRVTLLAALDKASRQRMVRPTGDLNRLEKFLDSNQRDEALVEMAARAAGRWQVESLRSRLVEMAQAPAVSDRVRSAAMEGVALMGGQSSRNQLERLAGGEFSLETRTMAVAALASLNLPEAARHAVEILARSDSDEVTSRVVRSFLERKAGPKALAAALAEHAVPADVAKVGIRLAKISGADQPELVEALTRAGSLTTPPQPLSAEQMQMMVTEVLERGDPARGENVFRRKDLNCFKCHTIAGAGGQVGPDLVSIGASAQVDYLVDSLLDPNKQVKEGFHSIVLATKEGRLITGIRVRQSDTELILRDAEDQEVAVLLNSIEEQKTGGSIMPSGLADPLTRAEFLDLVRFLSQLGKVGPYSVSKSRLARRWQVPEVSPAAAQEIRHVGVDGVVDGKLSLKWRPAYSKVSGVLPREDLDSLKIPYQSSNLSLVRCAIQVTSPGPVRIALNSADGLRVWVDTKALDAQDQFDVQLSPGVHSLTFAMDMARRTDGLLCELLDVPGSSAQAQFVLGN